MSEQTLSKWTAESILSFLREHSAELTAMGVQKIGLFGSYARGEEGPDSDLDFIFTMEHLTWTGWMDVWNYLEDSFGLGVDLVPEKDLRPELQNVVLSEVLYVEGV